MNVTDPNTKNAPEENQPIPASEPHTSDPAEQPAESNGQETPAADRSGTSNEQ